MQNRRRLLAHFPRGKRRILPGEACPHASHLSNAANSREGAPNGNEGKLFKVRVLNTGEVRIARYHRTVIGDLPLKFPCFADPHNPEDHRSWLDEGWGAVAVSRVADTRGS